MKHKQKQKTKRAMMKSIMYFLRQTKLIASKVKAFLSMIVCLKRNTSNLSLLTNAG